MFKDVFIYYLGLIIRNLKTYRNWTNFLYIPSSSPIQSSYHYSMGMKNTQKVLKTNPTQTKPVEHTLKNKHIRTQFLPNYQHTHTAKQKSKLCIKNKHFHTGKINTSWLTPKVHFFVVVHRNFEEGEEKNHWNYPNQFKRAKQKVRYASTQCNWAHD